MKPQTRSKKRPVKQSAKETLKALIIGDTLESRDIADILDSLTPLGFNLNLACVVRSDKKKPPPKTADKDLDFTVCHDYEAIIREQPPDVVILTSHDRKLHKRLLQILPSHTQIMDPFALEAFQALKQVSGQLGTAENRLRSVEMIKEVLMAGSGVSILVIDEDFKVLDINNAILSRTKMSKKGCIGRACHWVIHRRIEPCESIGCPASQVLMTDRSTHVVREEKKNDDSSRYFTVSAYPLGEDERGKKCVLMVWKDVTRGFEPVLDRQARSMKHNFSHILHHDKMVALGKLAAAAVHDINNPIQGILTFAKLMRASLDTGSLSPDQIEKFRTYLDLIAIESSRCGDIMRSLLSFARLGTLEKSPVDLNSLLDEILLLIGNRMELQCITCRRELAKNLLPIWGDRNQVKQALLNLVLNSVEAMPNGGEITIEASLQTHSDHMQIQISDTGTGIPRSLQANIFEPFVTTKEFGKGTGLGLSVVYGIITQHGGTIELQRDEVHGTTFVVTLPVYLKDTHHMPDPHCS
ncbi:MAG: PAS domain-containing protein [Desulfomonile tiedjei]|uniref:histidine kinase n=1 Tax=Desulfomonile tiedjei TaxID=2358 RepID=A0A9D6UYC0_9BACT|nr:PAS domain-containing protein [Desulfomonile tiedjei]